MDCSPGLFQLRITFKLNKVTTWNKILLEKLIVTQLVEKLPASYGSRRFITVFTTAHHWLPTSASWIQTTYLPYMPVYPKYVHIYHLSCVLHGLPISSHPNDVMWVVQLMVWATVRVAINWVRRSSEAVNPKHGSSGLSFRSFLMRNTKGTTLLWRSQLLLPLYAFAQNHSVASTCDLLM